MFGVGTHLVVLLVIAQPVVGKRPECEKLGEKISKCIGKYDYVLKKCTAAILNCIPKIKDGGQFNFKMVRNLRKFRMCRKIDKKLSKSCNCLETEQEDDRSSTYDDDLESPGDEENFGNEIPDDPEDVADVDKDFIADVNCVVGDGLFYRGPVSTTITGLDCQIWDDQLPHVHSRNPYNYPEGGLGSHNNCRNPDGEETVWCYTMDPTVRYQKCYVPKCPEQYTYYCQNNPGYYFRGNVLKTLSRLRCSSTVARFTPGLVDRSLVEDNSCRNLPEDNMSGVWCFNENGEQELCDVPGCEEYEGMDTECWRESDRGTNYRGMVSVTRDGIECQTWSSVTPHVHRFTAPDATKGIANHNYCRNPDREMQPWCYTIEETVRWGVCDIPECK